MTAMTFAAGGIGAWMPTYVYERETRFEITNEALRDLGEGSDALPEEVLNKLQPLKNQVFFPIKDFDSQLTLNLSPGEKQQYQERILNKTSTPSLGTIGGIFGAILVVGGLGATLLGGIAGDKLRTRFSGSYFLVSGISMLMAFPLILAVLVIPFPLAWLIIFIAIFFLFFNTGPTNTILANVTHPGIRSTGYALNIFIIHAYGDAISPVVMGAVTDRFNRNVAFAVVAVAMLIGGILWIWGARYLDRDTRNAPHQLNTL
jgi:MFS family permease